MATKFTDNAATTSVNDTDIFALSQDNTPSPGFTSKKITWANIKAAIIALIGGDVYGPASVADGATALFDGGTGKLIKAGAVPPLIFKGFLTQTGTSAPGVTTVYNTLGITVTCAYVSVGLYTLTLGNVVVPDINKLWCKIGSGNAITISNIHLTRVSPGGQPKLLINTLDNAGASADAQMDGTPIEIEVYP